jgi:hypothetical protein
MSPLERRVVVICFAPDIGSLDGVTPRRKVGRSEK